MTNTDCKPPWQTVRHKVVHSFMSGTGGTGASPVHLRLEMPDRVPGGVHVRSALAMSDQGGLTESLSLSLQGIQ